MLRPYQQSALDQIRAHFAAGKRRVLLVMPTGAGKTVVFSEVLKGTVGKGNRGAMAVRGKQLVEQASQRLFREDVHHGVMMANHWNKKPKAPIQLCSIDTLYSRQKMPEAKVYVIDEAHMANGAGYDWFLSQIPPESYLLSVTATPHVEWPLNRIADAIVQPTTVLELMELGYLVPPRYYAPSTPDLKGVRKQNGDYAASQLEDRMSTLTGDIIGHWMQFASDRPTVLFACNISHSMSLAAQFTAAGIRAEHIEGNNSEAERAAALGRLESGETKVLCNVGVLCTGVDIPFLGALIMARPTQSYNLYIQMAGRGTRLCPERDKRDFLLLDHAGNVLRHGFITDEREVDLDGTTKVKSDGPKPYTCSCMAVFDREIGACPDCGTPVGPSAGSAERERTAVEVPGKLEELCGLTQGQEVMIFITRLKEIRKKKGYKRGWVYHQLKERFGVEIAETMCPKRYLPPWLERGS